MNTSQSTSGDPSPTKSAAVPSESSPSSTSGADVEKGVGAPDAAGRPLIAPTVSPEDSANSDDDDDGEDNEEDDELNAYNKDYEAVLRIREQLESSKRKSSFFRQLCPKLSLECILPKRKREYKLLGFVVFLLFVIVAGLSTVYYFYEEQPFYVYRGSGIVVNEKTLDVDVLDAGGRSVLKGRLWRTCPVGRLPYDCSAEESPDPAVDSRELCLLWKRLQQLKLRDYRINDDVTCHELSWTAVDPSVVHWDCFRLDGAHLYGGGLVGSGAAAGHQWPLDGGRFPRRRFVVGSPHDADSFGPVLEKYWLLSRGVAIVVPDDAPLEISLNDVDDELCLISDHTRMMTSRPWNATFAYSICVADDLRVLHRSSLPFADRDAYSVVPTTMLEDPVWSTWSALKDGYNQSALVAFARDAARLTSDASGRQQHRRQLMLLDDGWEGHYGDMDFRSGRFDDPAQMVRDLADAGFRASAWFHAYLNTDSESFQLATARGSMARSADGDVPRLIRWWNGPHVARWGRGVAGIVDLTDGQTADWYVQKLNQFRNANGFDAIHHASSRVPMDTFFNRTTDANGFARLTAGISSSLRSTSVDGGPPTIIQSAYRCQSLPVLVRLVDGASVWNGTGQSGDSAGLSGIIPSILTLGLVGYPIVLPEAVGGSAVDGRPSKELYVRWLELAAFLPLVHLSIPPGDYDAETTSIAAQMLKLHREVVVPAVALAINQSADHRSPVVRPLWWMAPDDEHALVCSTQFLVGDSILVAPVLGEGLRQRDIYLPAGVWQDEFDGSVRRGPTWLRGYPVPLDKIAYFSLRH